MQISSHIHVHHAKPVNSAGVSNVPNSLAITSITANFKQVVKDGDLRLHPLITRLVDKETLEKIGAKPASAELQPES